MVGICSPHRSWVGEEEGTGGATGWAGGVNVWAGEVDSLNLDGSALELGGVGVVGSDGEGDVVS